MDPRAPNMTSVTSKRANDKMAHSHAMDSSRVTLKDGLMTFQTTKPVPAIKPILQSIPEHALPSLPSFPTVIPIHHQQQGLWKSLQQHQPAYQTFGNKFQTGASKPPLPRSHHQLHRINTTNSLVRLQPFTAQVTPVKNNNLLPLKPTPPPPPPPPVATSLLALPSTTQAKGVMLPPESPQARSQAVSWLNSLLQTRGTRPSVALSSIIASCSVSYNRKNSNNSDANAITEASITAAAIRRVGALQFDQPEREHMALVLYYMALEELLLGEWKAAASGEAAVCKLLASETFHKGVMLCAVECVLGSFLPETDLAFPASLGLLNISAFELTKLVDPFLRALPNLPPALKTHLLAIEEKLLESMSWEKGSTFFKVLSAAASRRSDINEITTPTMSPAAALNTSNPELFNTCPTSIGSITSLGEQKEPAAYRAITEFTGRLNRLIALRLTSLLAALNLPQVYPHTGLMAQAYSAMQAIVHHHTWLLYDRHLDQILLCCLYGVCKANQVGAATFKALLTAYRAQPHARVEVYKCVRMPYKDAARYFPSLWKNAQPNQDETQEPTRVESGQHVAEIEVVGLEFPADGSYQEETSDIITFYNFVFLPAVKSMLQSLVQHVKLSQQQQQQTSGTLGQQQQQQQQPLNGNTAIQHQQRQQQVNTGGRSFLRTRSLNRQHSVQSMRLSPGHWKMTPAGVVYILPSPAQPLRKPTTASATHVQGSNLHSDADLSVGNKNRSQVTSADPSPSPYRPIKSLIGDDEHDDKHGFGVGISGSRDYNQYDDTPQWYVNGNKAGASSGSGCSTSKDGDRFTPRTAPLVHESTPRGRQRRAAREGSPDSVAGGRQYPRPDGNGNGIGRKYSGYERGDDNNKNMMIMMERGKNDAFLLLAAAAAVAQEETLEDHQQQQEQDGTSQFSARTLRKKRVRAE